MNYPWLHKLYHHLVSRLEAIRLHHALLLIGHEGVGKRALSMALCRRILCQTPRGYEPCGQCQSCRLLSADFHPDLYLLTPESSIGVDAIRAVITQLMSTAQLSGAKILLVEKAHLMTEAAANSLLKTLEEPPENTFIILLTEQPEQLPATIRSRCQQERLAMPSVESIQQWLVAQGYPCPDEETIAAYHCAPLKIQAACEDQTIDGYKQLKQSYQRFLSGELDAVLWVKEWKDKESLMLAWLQKILHQQARYDGKLSWAHYLRVTEGLRELEQTGINRQLLLISVLQTLRS